METNQITVKVSKETRDTLRLVAALTGEKHHEVLNRLVLAEKNKLSRKS